jgi:hypothetical protein
MHGSERPSTGFEIEPIPSDMAYERRWLNWRTELRDGKWTKVPVDPHTGANAKSNDPETWGTLTDAWEHALERDLGIGFALGDGWLGVDIDDCTSKGGPVEPWVDEWLRSHAAYAERSVSGTGVHVITRGTVLPAWSANRRGRVEVYQANRYFTVSGDALYYGRECPPIQDALEALCRAHLAKPTIEAPAPVERLSGAPGGLDDSASDWALVCGLLQQGKARDVVEATLRLKMQQEGRGEKASRPDYIPNTVAKAAQSVVVQPGRRYQPPPMPRVLEVKPFRKTETEPAMRPVVVEGLVRRGEVCNWIGAPKTGKSWLLHRLICGMVGGGGFPGGKQGRNSLQVERGRVLLCDVELHAETLENRLWWTATQTGTTAADLEANLDLIVGRGLTLALQDIEETVAARGKGYYQAICLDAFYRFIPAGMSENENADMTQLYNAIDRIALAADAAIFVVHHTTKGVQTSKSIMDVGAGAGAIGRATDTHITFLRHRQEGCISMQAETRSFPRPEARVLSQKPAFPCLAFDEKLDPTDLWYPGCEKDEDE